MSTEENKVLIRRWIDLWNSQHVAAVDEFITPNFVRHDPNIPEVRGIEAEKQLLAMYFAAFPDLHLTIEDLIAEGDTVTGRYTVRGSHKGELMGIPPTNNVVTVTAIEIYRIADGKIVEQWALVDVLSMMQQLGVIPMPGQTA